MQYIFMLPKRVTLWNCASFEKIKLFSIVVFVVALKRIVVISFISPFTASNVDSGHVLLRRIKAVQIELILVGTRMLFEWCVKV